MQLHYPLNPTTGAEDASQLPWTNGVPSTGTEGSYPPAAMCVETMDEIVSAINEASLTPTSSDLTQLLRAIRSGQMSTFTDTGAVNAMVVTPITAHTSLAKGLPLRVFPAFTNTSTTVSLKVGTLTGNVFKNAGGAPAAGDIVVGHPIDVVYDTTITGWRLMSVVASDLGNYVFSPDTGTAGAIVAAAPSPAVPALKVGLTLVVVPAALNAGPTTINLAGLGAKPVIYPNGSPFIGGEMQPRPQVFVYDGTSWQWQGQQAPILQQALTLYVNYATGSDSNNGLTTGTAFKTVQAALTAAASINGNGKTLTIKLADSTSYPSFSVTSAFNGLLTIVGNTTTPSNVVITGVGTNSAAVSATVNVTLSGMTIQNTGTSAAHGIVTTSGAIVTSGPGLVLGSCVYGDHIHLDTGNFAAVFVYTANGNAINHISMSKGQVLLTPSSGGAITITGSAALSGSFMVANDLSYARVANVTFSGAFTSGTKYSVTGNSVVETGGAGINFFPAPSTGFNASGGQYL